MRFISSLMAFSLAVMATATFAQERNLADFPKLDRSTDWPWWRGPNRDGTATGTAPTRLSETDHLTWKSPVPGRGHSSPIVVGQQVFLTTADEADQKHSVLALDRVTGQMQWQTPINQGAFPARNHAKNTEATPTVACDGERLFATFYHHDMVEAVALDLRGQILWRQKVAEFHPRKYEYGYAPSPVLYQGTVIVATEHDGDSYITALDRQTGRKIWQQKRLPLISFSTPSIGLIAGKDQLLLSGQEFVSSFNPQSGKPNWVVKGTTFATCGTMTWDGDKVFASGGYPKAETIAIRADGSGAVLWRNNQKCYEQSMIVHAGHLFALTDNGVLFCWDGETGEERWKERLAGPVSASPVLAGNNIYWANEAGTLWVFQANPKKFQLVEKNQLGDSAFASPAICGGQVFLRVAKGDGAERREWLYCFGP